MDIKITSLCWTLVRKRIIMKSLFIVRLRNSKMNIEMRLHIIYKIKIQTTTEKPSPISILLKFVFTYWDNPGVAKDVFLSIFMVFVI